MSDIEKFRELLGKVKVEQREAKDEALGIRLIQLKSIYDAHLGRTRRMGFVFDAETGEIKEIV